MPAISSAVAGDRDRFEQIYRENFRAVLRFAAARIDPERAKDVAAETFLVAWRRLDDVPAEPRAWLFGIARRIVADQFRSQTRREALAKRLRGAEVGTPRSILPSRLRIATPPSPHSWSWGNATAKFSGSSRGTG